MVIEKVKVSRKKKEKVKVKREINVKVKVAAKKDLPILRQSPQQSALMRGDNRGY